MEAGKKRVNLLEGMQPEEQRLADENAFFEYFDYLESKEREARSRKPTRT